MEIFNRQELGKEIKNRQISSALWFSVCIQKYDKMIRDLYFISSV